MTVEEAIQTLITIDSGYSPNFVANGHIAMGMAIKALEQEPILDKIRAEIHATAELHEDGDYYLRDEWIDEIFDKYKAESEEQA